MPLWAFILVLVVCLALIGFVCAACLGDQLVPGLERPFAPAVIVVWVPLLGLLSPLLLVASPVSGVGRSSPARLQRFLF